MNKSIYFLASRDAIKIGFSTQPGKRVADLSGGAPERLTLIGMIPGDRYHEQDIHARLAEHRLNGEWFSDCEPVRELINRLLADGVSFLQVKEPEARDPDEFIDRAQYCARVIIRYSVLLFPGATLDRIKAIEDNYSIQGLWALLYRTPTEITAGTYFSLLDGTEQFLSDVENSVGRELNVIKEINAKRLADMESLHAMETEIRRLETELEAARRGLDSGGRADVARKLMLGDNHDE